MKIRKLMTGLVLIFLLVACSKEDTPTNLPEGGTSISANIGDDSWEALDYKSSLNVIPGKGQFFELRSFNSKYKIELSVLEFDSSSGTISEGTYKENMLFSIFIADEEGNFFVEYKPIEAEEEVENPFSIKITASSSSRISGTFSGIVYRISEEHLEDYPEVLQITNGIFNNLPFETHTINIQ